jgi:nucleoside-diphosphate kinase
MQPTECSATPMHGKPGTAGERSFIMVKPEGVARGLVSEIIGRWEKRGYTLVAIKVVQPDAKLAGAHYADLSARPFFKDLVHYMSSSGPVVAMVWQGKDVIKVSRDMIGMTNPLTSPPGTVRGDLACNIGRNVIHGSDGVEGAASEIPLWFAPHEVIDIDSTKWPQHVGLYLYDTKQA